MTILYAILHKSGNYLPASWPRTSFWEGEKGKGPPKFFVKASHAKGWITSWLKGRAVKRYYSNVWGDDEIIELEYEKVPSRSRDQITIVPVELNFMRPL